MEKETKLMDEIKNNIKELKNDISLDTIRNSLDISDTDNIYMISKHDLQMPKFVMITDNETLLANMNYLLEDLVLNNKVTVKRPSTWYKNKTLFGIMIHLKYRSKYTCKLKKYSYYVYPQLVDTNVGGAHRIPVFKCMSVRRLICVGSFIVKSIDSPNELRKLDILGFTFNGIGETLNTYKKLFDKRHNTQLNLTTYAEISLDNVDIENFSEDYSSPYYSSELNDVINKIIFVINSRKHTFYTVFPEPEPELPDFINKK